MYAIALFVHIIGVLSLFGGLTAITVAVLCVQRAERAEQVRALLAPFSPRWKVGFEELGVLDVVVVVGVFAIAGSGLAMASKLHAFSDGWVAAATVALLLVGPIGPFMIDPRLRALLRAAQIAPDGPMGQSLRAQTRERLLAVPPWVVLGVLVGIVFLMTNKPSLVLSIVALGTSAAGGLLLGFVASRGH